MNPFLKKLISLSLCASMLFLGLFSGAAQAKMLSTNEAHAIQSKADIVARISDQAVQDKLVALGVNPDELKSRINNLSPDELNTLNQQIDQLPAGGDALSLLVFVFVVLVITDMIGATDVFPFVNQVTNK